MVVPAEYDSLDVKIFNLLRCEPPTLAFDFFTYGGLPRSVLRKLQNIPDLEQRVQERNAEIIQIPTHQSENPEDAAQQRRHMLNYNFEPDTLSIMANSYNGFSHQSDFKVFARANIGKYQANLVILEVYREKGDRHPIWELGLYITEKGKRPILYAEETILDIDSDVSNRIQVQASACSLISSLKHTVYDPTLRGRNHEPSTFRYLNLPAELGATHIDQDEFQKRRATWLRYLIGTMDVEKVVKLEDRCGYTDAIRVYRVEIVSTHLTENQDGKYLIEIIGETVGKEHDPRNRSLQEGPYTHSEARARFLSIVNTYLQLLHINAEKGNAPFEVTEDPTHIDFRYATVIKDREKNPITLSSWESRYNGGGLLLRDNQTHHYLLLHNSSPEPLRLDEGIHFPQDSHPREFMPGLIGLIKNVHYDQSRFLEQAAAAGLPLTISKI